MLSGSLTLKRGCGQKYLTNPTPVVSLTLKGRLYYAFFNVKLSSLCILVF